MEKNTFHHEKCECDVCKQKLSLQSRKWALMGQKDRAENIGDHAKISQIDVEITAIDNNMRKLDKCLEAQTL